MSLKVAVTGSSGFIGSSLCLSLISRGYLVRRLTRRSNSKTNSLLPNDLKTFLTDDVRTDLSEALRGVDCVIHCAGLSSVSARYSNPLEKYRAGNVEYSRIIAQEAIRMNVKRFVYLSTIKVNGESTSSQACFTNQSAMNPQSPYAKSKSEAEEVIKSIAEQGGMEYVIVRPPLVYGPLLSGNLIKLLGLVYVGIPLPFKSVINSRSMVSLDNLIDLLILSMTSHRVCGETLLVSDGYDLSTPDLLLAISRYMKKRQILFSVSPKKLQFLGKLIGKERELEKLTGSLRVDISHTNEVANWSPPLSIGQGLRQMVDWYMSTK